MLCNSIILITGPTSCGKTSLSISLAKYLSAAEIISVDSRQFYREMDIGTAKPTPQERALVKHHFIDSAAPDCQLNAGEFARRARAVIDGLIERQITPILVGGSGMYWKAVIDGFFEDDVDYSAIRSQLQRQVALGGIAPLYNELKILDPQSHHRIAANDTQRILRALEVARMGGAALARRWHGQLPKPNYRTVMIWLDRQRPLLYRGIDMRVDAMIEQGLLEEVEKLQARGYGRHTSAMNSMGYVEMLRYMEGELSWDLAVEEIKKSTRHFAKRQITWFRKDRRLRRLDVDQWGVEGCSARIAAQYREVRKAVFPIDS